MPAFSFSQVEFKILLYLIIVISAVFHEYMHAWMAYTLGDPTAKYQGRLTLNPMAHLDTWGTVFIPLIFLFYLNGFIGWAKPVPYNPHNLRDQRRGPALVGAAGPATNLFLALVFGLALRFSSLLGDSLHPFIVSLMNIFPLIVFINLALCFFNFLPIPPLDGSKFFGSYLPRSFQYTMLSSPFLGIFLALLVANIVLPPLTNAAYRVIVGTPFFI